MKKNTAIVFLVLAIVAVAVGAYFFYRHKTKTEAKEESVPVPPQSLPPLVQNTAVTVPVPVVEKKPALELITFTGPSIKTEVATAAGKFDFTQLNIPS